MSLAALSGAVAPPTVNTTSVTVTASATAYTKGSWVQVTAGFTYACSGLKLSSWVSASTPTIAYASFVDIAFGAAGSEVVVLRDWPCAQNAYNEQITWPWLPLQIPPNTRVSLRVSSTQSAAVAWNVLASFLPSSPLTPAGSGLVTCVGLANPVASFTGGSNVQIGSTQGVYGTPVLYASAVPHRVRWLSVMPVTVSGATYRLLTIKVSADASGANIIAPMLLLNSQGGNAQDWNPQQPALAPCDIAQGSPLYLSMSADLAGYSTVYTFGVHLFG